MKPLKIVNNLNVPKETERIKKKMAKWDKVRYFTSLQLFEISRPNPQAQDLCLHTKKESAILSSAELIEQYWFHFKHSVCWFSSETEDRCSSC